MARLRCDFYADTLELSTSMTLLLPDSGPTDPAVLYLLHGLTDDDTSWTRQTSIERYAADRDLAVVLPQVHRSFYADEAHGSRYWTFLTDELPEVVARYVRISDDPGRTYVAGLSMGGYGALRWGLSRPERFSAVASMSAPTDMATRLEGSEWDRPDVLDRVFDHRGVRGGPLDLLHLLAEVDVEAMPPIWLGCGVDDPLVAENERFAVAARERELDLTVEFGPGAHEWDYWDRSIRQVLDWLPR